MPKTYITRKTGELVVNSIARTLGQNIAQARRRRRWRVADLAKLAGLTVPTVKRVERGRLGTGIGAYIAALQAMDLHWGFDSAAAREFDDWGVDYAETRIPHRIHPRPGEVPPPSDLAWNFRPSRPTDPVAATAPEAEARPAPLGAGEHP